MHAPRPSRPQKNAPSEEPAAVAERLVQMSAEELRELRRRLQERLAPASAEL